MNVLGKIQKSTKHFFFFSIEKEVKKIDKDGNESVVTISYKIKFIDSARFIASSLLNLKIKIVILFLNMKASRTI